MASDPASSAPDRPHLDADTRARMKAWLANWERVGRVLEEERWSRVEALTETKAARDALDLWRFAVPGRGDDGEGLRMFTRAARRP